MQDSLPDFHGKVVFVQLPDQGSHWSLESPYFVRQGGMLCLTGKPMPLTRDHWSSGATVFIQWRYIAYYVVYDSIEDYRSRKFGHKPPTKEVEARRGWFGRRNSP